MRGVRDLVVVGAGPAGCATAASAARRGVDVLLIEREMDIGVPMMCGEFIPALAEMRALTPRARGLRELFTVPEKAVANRTRFVRFTLPDGRELQVEFEGLVLERKLFDRHLAIEAARAGAETMISTTATALLREGGILAKSGPATVKIPARAVAVADGAFSPLARRAGLQGPPDPMDFAVALQYEMANVDVDAETVEMYLGRGYAPGAYAWIIPKGDGVANVGTGARSPYMEGGLTVREYLERFIRRHPKASERLRRARPIAVRAGTVPVGGPLPRTFTGNLVVVGDAAGQAIPTVGGGISTALICGRIAGEAVAGHLEASLPLSRYEDEWKREVGETLSNSLRLRRVGDLFLRSDRAVGLIARRGWLNEDVLGRFIRCQLDRTVFLIEKALSRLQSPRPTRRGEPSTPRGRPGRGKTRRSGPSRPLGPAPNKQ